MTSAATTGASHGSNRAMVDLMLCIIAFYPPFRIAGRKKPLCYNSGMEYLLTGLAVFVANMVPFFMPATWTVLSYLAIRFSLNVFVISVIGAVAATLGRVALAKLARFTVRQRFLSEKTKRNIDHLKEYVEEKKTWSFAIFLAYAFSPLPSNQLFIAFGLTNLDIKRIAIPFFVGRIVSYTFWTLSATELAERYAEPTVAKAAGLYFIAGQVLIIILLWLFTKLDWRMLLREKKIRLIE